MKLVFIENNRPVTDSLTVAQVFGKEHKHVVRDIENQISKLFEAEEGEFVKSNFGLEIFQSSNNKDAKKYNLTEDSFAIVAMSYVTPEAMKMKVRFLDEFKTIRDQLRNNVLPIDERTVRMNLLKTAFDHEGRLETIENKMDEVVRKVDEQITLDSGEQRKIQKAMTRKIYGMESDRKIRSEYFRQLHREIHDRWAVPSYKDVRRYEFDGLLKYIEAWMPKKIA